jgi:hypothetical protein
MTLPVGRRAATYFASSGKIQSFNYYPSGTIILAPLGVFPAQPRD